MKKLIFGIIFILILFPTSQSFSQEYTDTNPTLTVSTNSNTNYVYQDSEGYTVVIYSCDLQEGFTGRIYRKDLQLQPTAVIYRKDLQSQFTGRI